jgi:hypothetical protein
MDLSVMQLHEEALKEVKVKKRREEIPLKLNKLLILVNFPVSYINLLNLIKETVKVKIKEFFKGSYNVIISYNEFKGKVIKEDVLKELITLKEEREDLDIIIKKSINFLLKLNLIKPIFN